ncbi:5'-nucleotidase C-terminal domain-containing protein [Kribbia dieselivorans]|uniref:5'-nucleotidase C-terminal domain-containing protein n=1 Tax=Kribbia dieselivorans TaxID=331526 RepID=UPI000838FD48|nr:5'-nucleotidase C-terminal domain-containing protein [Kribbia dieselivorans]
MRLHRTAAAAGVAALVASGVTALPASAAQELPAGQSISATLTKVSLLSINDFHGYFSNDFACTLVTEQQARGGASKAAFVSAGDNVGGSAFASAAQNDQPTIDFLNALGLQASAAGNHEFDQGFADLTGRLTPKSNFPILAANVYKKGTTEPAMEGYKVLDVNGVKVGFIGAVTPSTAAKVSPDGIKTIDFGNAVDAVNRVADQLTDGNAANGEADLLVAAYHEGATVSGKNYADTKASSTLFADMADKTSAKVSVILNGDSHQQYLVAGPIPGGAGANDTRPITQSGNYGSHVGAIDLGWDAAAKKVVEYKMANVARIKPADADYTAKVAACETNPAYTNAKTIADAANAAAAEIGKQEIGEATADITRANLGADRTTESALSNMIAQSYLDSLAKHQFGNATIGVMNPGGVRADLLKGKLTYKQAADIMPFNNIVKTVDVTGAQFKAILEEQWKSPEAAPARAAYLQLGLSKNVTYTFDPDAAFGSHITSITVDGQPINPTKTYNIASNNFLLEGGDGFVTFAKGTNLKDSGLVDMSLFVEWIKDKSPLTPDFTKHALAVSPSLPATAKPGDRLTFSVSSLNMTSAGAPVATQVTAKLGGQTVGTFDASAVTLNGTPNRPGNATIQVTIPQNVTGGAQYLEISWNGSTALLPITITLLDQSATPVPGISGTARVGSKLTARPGAWDAGVTKSYQWLRNGAAIAGATKSTYTLTAADAGAKVSVAVTGTKAGYTTVTKTSTTRTVAKGILTGAKPKITGTKKAGSTLKVVRGTWKPSGISFSYRWYSNGKAISGATKSSYKVSTAQRGKRITVKVTGRKAGYITKSKTSAPVGIARR